jgi:hypothetical protein
VRNDLGWDIRFEEGVQLVYPVDLYINDVRAFSREIERGIFERRILRHAERWYEAEALHCLRND